MFSLSFFLTSILVIGIIYLSCKCIYRSYLFYKEFHGNEELRNGFARDPKRFHISIIYLMGYMMRADGNNPKVEKLDIIVRYIKQVCPRNIFEDAVAIMDRITERKTKGKNARLVKTIDTEQCLIKRDVILTNPTDSNSLVYSYDLHGKRLAQELGNHLSMDDRRYLMYMLYCVAVAGKVSREEMDEPSKKALYNICVKGLKIEKTELEDLLSKHGQGKTEEWYESHFTNIYPSIGVFCNLHSHQKDNGTWQEEEYALDYNSMSRQKWTFTLLTMTASVLFFISLIIVFMKKDTLMTNAFGIVDLLFGVVVSICYFINLAIETPESCMMPTLRTEFEDKLQKRDLISKSIVTVLQSLVLTCHLPYAFFVVGNEAFATEECPVYEVNVNSMEEENIDKRTIYRAYFDPISFKDNIPGKMSEPEISATDRFCLRLVQEMPSVKIRNIRNDRELNSTTITKHIYESHPEKLTIPFKIGYYEIMIITDGE